MSVELRSCEIVDVPTVTKLDNEVFGAHGYPVCAIRQFADLADSLFVVAADEHHIIGYSLILPSIRAAEGWLVGLAVHQDRRREGIGRELMSNCLDRAQGIGLRTVRLTVDPANAPAKALYKSLGFAVDSFVDDYFGPGEPRLVMTLRLS